MHYDSSIDEHFIKTALLQIKDEQFFTSFQKLYRNVLKSNVGLLGEVIARVEGLLDKHNNPLIQGQILSILKFLDQQKAALSPKMISYIEQCLDNSDLQKDAFKILQNLVQKGAYNLSDKCLAILNKLAAGLKFERPDFLTDALIIASNKEYLSIFTTLLDVKYINLEVLNNLPSYKYWARELLSYDLIRRTGEADHYELEVFDNNLMELEKSHHYDLVSTERDNFLLTLINLQKEYGYTLNQINQILEMFIGLPADAISKLDTTRDI